MTVTLGVNMITKKNKRLHFSRVLFELCSLLYFIFTFQDFENSNT